MSPRVGASAPSSSGRPDPLGKRALFGAPPGGPPIPASGGDSATFPDPFAPSRRGGRQVLYSSSATGVPRTPGRRGPLTATLVCRSCGTPTPLGVIGLVVRSVPSLWVPGRRWSRYLRCPACRRMSWCRMEWGR